jgi:hypothetical protein
MASAEVLEAVLTQGREKEVRRSIAVAVLDS